MGRLEDLARELADHRVSPPDDEAVEKAAPFLWEFLTMDQWGDGTERILPQLVVDRVSGGYRCTLKDDALNLKKSVVVRCFADIPAGLERALNDEDVPWENFRSFRNKKGPKVPEKEKPPRRKRG